MTRIIAIVGPTATGKTSLAVRLCSVFGGEIVSVDSRQAYREMEIGTGKDRRDLPPNLRVHLYDLVSPRDRLSAFDFSRAAERAIRGISERDQTPFLVGGSGFYLDVILGRRRLANIGPDLFLRSQLEALTSPELIERLRVLNPQRLQQIDAHNRQRLMRAIEIERAQPFEPKVPNQKSDLDALHSFDPLIVGLTAENGFIYKRADQRVDDLLAQGLTQEVAGLVKKYGWEAPGLKTLGYHEFRPFFEGAMSLAEVILRLKFNTHAYIRRQKTYFKRNPSIIWFNITETEFERRVVREVESFLRI